MIEIFHKAINDLEEEQAFPVCHELREYLMSAIEHGGALTPSNEEMIVSFGESGRRRWWFVGVDRLCVVITRKDLEEIYRTRPDLKSAQVYFQMSGGEK